MVKLGQAPHSNHTASCHPKHPWEYAVDKGSVRDGVREHSWGVTECSRVPQPYQWHRVADAMLLFGNGHCWMTAEGMAMGMWQQLHQHQALAGKG